MQGTEVTCGCYKTTEKSVVFPITEVVSKNEFFDYEAKYTASKVEEITPARISEEIAEEISSTTSKIYDLIGAKGIIRVDYIIIQGEPYLLEVNTTPGMTTTSFIPQQIRAMASEPGVVLEEIIEDIMQTK
jgi:D-alanine-D-alanine ligase